jgi:RNA polymerase sigma factor (sigma-70 family)
MSKKSREPDTVRFLMQSAGKFPLLTGDEEIHLGRQIQAMMKVLELPKNELPEDGEIIISRGQKAKNRMIEGNLRLVINVAKRYRDMGLPFEDLIQEGTIGLNRGVEKFDPERGFKASTYLSSWIKQGITVALGNKSKMIRLPMHMNERIYKLRRITCEMIRETGKWPSAETLREVMELNQEQWEITLSSLQDVISYDIKLSEKDNQTSLFDLLPSDLENPQENLDSIDERERLEQLLSEIGEREAQVLRLRYGIGQQEGQSLEKIGQTMGISRERVRQIQTKAMRSVRKVAVQTKMSA